MKTTIEIEDSLFRRAKAQATRSGVTLRAIVEEALRAHLLPRQQKRRPFVLKFPVVRGSSPPAVDISDRDALYDLMEDDRG